MKTKLLLSAILFFSFYLLSSQVPQGFNYQAVARNSAGTPLIDVDLQVKIGILSDTVTPVVVWEELHSDVTTDVHGIFSLVIGSGARQDASSASEFNEIDWTLTPLYLKTQIYYQGTWKDMGSAQLWSVPYALVAGELEGPFKKLAVTGETSVPDEALFEVKNKDDQIVFAVYNEGVRVYVNNEADGVKGGFAIGGFGGAEEGVSQNLLTVSPDSVRIYVDETTVKGSKGGFSIGGFGLNKAPSQEYLRVTRDSTRVYVNQDIKGSKGGFSIGGFGNSKDVGEDFLNLTPENYFIGHQSGAALTTGLYNSFIGYLSGSANTTGNSNSFLGYQTGLSNIEGSSNVFIGNESGKLNTSGDNNVFLGNSAGYTNDSGENNVLIGFKAGYALTSNSYNTYMGYQSGADAKGGDYNLAIGPFAGYSNKGDYNVFIGYESGYNNINGADARFSKWNTFIGYQSGKGNTTGWQNLIIGYQAGLNNQAATNQLFIGNNSGQALTEGYGNTFVGHGTGTSTTSAENNTYVGYYAGYNNPEGVNNTYLGYGTGGTGSSSNNVLIGSNAGAYEAGDDNVIIGSAAGYQNIGSRNIFIGRNVASNLTLTNRASDMLLIDNSNTATPLIGGDFFNNRVGINRMPTTYTLEVGGTIWANGTAITAGLTTWSDARYKTNIVPFDNALLYVMKMQGVRYDWCTTDFPDLNFPGGEQIGIIAQDLEKIIPELVVTGPDGYKSVDYSKLSPVLIEAVKEQQKIIENQAKELQSLKGRIEQIEAILKAGEDK